MRDYTEYNYTKLVEDITASLGQKEGWGEGYESSTGQMLIQLFSDTTDALMYMLERRVQEAFISTAELRQSIFAHASELGYRPRRTVCMTGTLELVLRDQQGNVVTAQEDVVIPKYTRVHIKDPNVEFVVTEQAIVRKGQSSVHVTVKEGTRIQQTFFTNTDYFAEYRDVLLKDYINIDEYSLSVTSQGLQFYDVETTTVAGLNYGSLSYARGTDRVYDVRYAIEGMRIVFGDNQFGSTPVGDVTLNYIQSNGVVAPILTLGIDFSFDTNILYDNDLITPRREYRYSLKNITPIRGYAPYESLEEIARNAPENARANSRAVTNSDFKYWALRSGIGGIVDVNSYGEQESGSLIFNMNNVHLSYATEDNLPLNLEQIRQFKAFLDRYKTVTTHVVVQEADKIELVVNVEHKKDSRFPVTNDHLYKILRESIESYFRIRRDSIGNEIQHSEFVEYLQNLRYTQSGITYFVTDFVKVSLQPQYKLINPVVTHDTKIYLDESYVPVEGDVWTIKIDSYEISITVQEGESFEDLVERMRVAISDATFYMTSRVGGMIRVTASYDDGAFSVDVGEGDLSSYVTTSNVMKIPNSVLFNTQQENLIVPGSAHIVDGEENIIYVDDGNGVLVNQVGGPDMTIDYINSEIGNPVLSDLTKDYFFRFQQNEFQNVKANDNAIIVLSPIAEEIGDDPLMSKIWVV